MSLQEHLCRRLGATSVNREPFPDEWHENFVMETTSPIDDEVIRQLVTGYFIDQGFEVNGDCFTFDWRKVMTLKKEGMKTRRVTVTNSTSAKLIFITLSNWNH